MELQQFATRKAGKSSEIARAALEQFTHKGFQAASLETIAAGAGVGKSTIYEYYKNKEELFAAAVREAIDLWFGQLSEIKGGSTDPIERLARIANAFMALDETPPGGSRRLNFEIMMQTIMEGGVLYNRKHDIRQVHQKLINFIADILLEGVSSGQLKPAIASDARKIAITYLSFLNGMTLSALVAEDDIDVRAQIAYFLDTLEPLLRMPGQAPQQSEKN